MENKLTDILSQADFKEIHAKILHCYEQSSRAGAHQEFLSEDRDLMRKVLEFEKALFAPSEPVGGVKGAEEILKSKFIVDGKAYYEWPNIRNRNDIYPKIIQAMQQYASQFQQPQVDEKLMKRDEKIGLLENFCTFLAANGYMDEDWRSEPPYAIDEFLKLTEKP